MKKTFIAIGAVTDKNKLIGLLISSGQAINDINGIDPLTAINFLFNLVHLRKRKGGVTFVCYGFSTQNEFIFSGLPSALRDKLFQTHEVKRNIDQLETEREDIDEVFYNVDQDTQDFERADFERHVVNASLAELQEVQFGGYDISLINGKSLTIRKNGKSISIYDIYGFFKGDSLAKSVRTWVGRDYALLINDANLLSYDSWRDSSGLAQQWVRVLIETSLIAKLAKALNDKLTDHNINLSRYHGAGAIASNLLSKSNAKESFHNYRHRRQRSPEWDKALSQGYYSGRAEQFKVGTADNIKVYDINSAYAFGCSFLPTLLRKPRFVRGWQAEPFSVWFCEYDFTGISPYFGFLPHRDTDNITRYKLKGSGYFWQPEIVYILNNYPQCIDVKYGFVYPYEAAPFTAEIENAYALRRNLQDKNDPLQKVIGLALSAIYGKFKQEKSHYYNLSYAGFITSLTRMKLLEAVKGNEAATICFQTDAIHSLEYLPIPITNDLGDYKLQEYARGTYLDSGIYQFYDHNGRIVKTKTQGFRTFNFEKALRDLKERNTYSAVAEFFIGHKLFVQNMFRGTPYLSNCEMEKTRNPLEADGNLRTFQSVPLDLSNGLLDSQISKGYSGRESSVFRRIIWKGADIGLDRIQTI